MDQPQTEVADSTFKEFWDNFRLSRSRAVTRPVYTAVITLLPYGTLLVAAIIADLSGKTDFEWTKQALTLWPMLIGTAFLLVITWAYYKWQDEIPVFFSWLYDGERITSRDGDLRQQYGQYLSEYQKRLLSVKGPLLFVVIGLIFVVVFSWVTNIPKLVTAFWSIGEAAERFIAIRFIIIWFFGFSVWAILFGLAAWPVYVTGRYLVALSDRLEVVVQPSHPDRCGGLKSWGDFCFNMTLPVVIGGLMLAIFGLGHSFLQDARVIVYETVVPVANAALILVIVPLTGISFFAPVSGVHRKMVQIKKAFEDQVAKRVAGLEEQIKANLDDPKQLADAKQAAQEIELLRVLIPNDYSYPEWPFDRSVPVKLFASPILSFAIQYLFDLFSRSNCCG
jgi:hypothetical protein